jgi:hypothetical protein
MKRYVLLFLWLGILFACSDRQQEQTKLQANKLIWSAYSWHLNDTTNQFGLYVGQYLEIAPNGEGLLMRHDTFMGTPHFYSFRLSNAELARINAAFANRAYADNYSPDEPLLYCGLAYRFEYILAKQTKTIDYIPPALPKSLRQIVELLEKSTVVERLQMDQKEGKNALFHYVGYSKKLEKQFIETDEVPVPPKASSIQFVSPSNE